MKSNKEDKPKGVEKLTNPDGTPYDWYQEILASQHDSPETKTCPACEAEHNHEVNNRVIGHDCDVVRQDSSHPDYDFCVFGCEYDKGGQNGETIK